MGLFDSIMKEYMAQFGKDVAADAEPVVYLPHGANANYCKTIQRRFTAIQFQHNAEDAGNLMQVLAFLVENGIPFGMRAHGNLHILDRDTNKQIRQVDDGEWILCSTDDVTEDGPADYRVYPTEALQREFSWSSTGPSTNKPFTVDEEEMNRVSESAVDYSQDDDEDDDLFI